ncbi:spermidine/putrescine transport system ATP-binding protein [Halarchaeum rubridurum]|uniref:Molybdate/tungstate import ATP-binding protein WtpC n=1 Tax=Halarchaeum rubridurum TaxID=489911 RepID=A0A830FMR8_9EURY|nr:ABC transporter ATP-binding protein [Halarchaeum rubridurum]MBP1953424.1 spermidine/putrescine transport system ATP-binding protein [Halarchaeum rubridurum]GGM65356.1 polyamine-transporting ATPase [Halarchaeum rubridurum]
MASVTLSDLRKEYGDLTAVDGLSLDVDDGELLCLLGPSGCGKSTTLRMLGGLETPTDGDVHIGGDAVTDQPPYERNTSMVFQSWALFPHKSVLENVAFGLKMDGVGEDERHERAREMLDVVEMSGFADHDPTDLSGGQKQRVALARSLAIEPDVLLLDEPLSNLDKRLREQMQLELRNIHDEVETTFVHVTHDQNEAFTLADRIGIMNDGQIEQVGAPREVYDDPVSLFIEEFLGDTNLVDATVTETTETGVVADTALGTEAAIPTGDAAVAAGDELTVSFRPEELDVERADGGASDGGASITGEITDVLYRGSSVRFYVESAGEHVFFEQSVGADTDFAVGDTVAVSWDPDDLLAFAADGDRVGGGGS